MRDRWVVDAASGEVMGCMGGGLTKEVSWVDGALNLVEDLAAAPSLEVSLALSSELESRLVERLVKPLVRIGDAVIGRDKE